MASERIKSTLYEWHPDKHTREKYGYGFCVVDGQRVYVHITSIHPRPDAEEDLTGREILIGWVSWKETKGPRAGNVILDPDYSLVDDLKQVAKGIAKLFRRR